ncbi:MAG: ribosome maturation factor RimP [Lachnospiraceae bacterium]|nr:ribosome maturation factor RimP [Lachnospiraceae bacterium]MCR5768389.1 ribosome maturation factor RimP [Lachnospiraceae bacterium]
MTKKEDYESRTEALLKPITDELGFEIVDVEFVKEGNDYYLRSYIDKEGGITIDDCETVSRRLDQLLDEQDFISEAYIMEVSSPGLGRTLKKEKDFIRENGKEVDVKLFKAMDKVKEFSGILKGFDADTFTIATEKGDITVERANVAKISLSIDF